jgi:hypothetical protein
VSNKEGVSGSSTKREVPGDEGTTIDEDIKTALSTLDVSGLHDCGIKDGSESKHNGTICIRDSRTEAKFSSAGLSTVKSNSDYPTIYKLSKQEFSPEISNGPSNAMTLYFPS